MAQITPISGAASDKRESRERILKMYDTEFYMFCEYQLGLTRQEILASKRLAPLSVDAMYGFLREYHQCGNIPDETVYCLVDEHRRSGQSSLRHLRMDLGIHISDDEYMLAREKSSEHRKAALLDLGITAWETRHRTPITHEELEGMRNRNFGEEKRTLLQLRQCDFICFCQEVMFLSRDIIKTAMKHAEPTDEAKRDHVQRAYENDKEAFVNRHRPQLQNLLHNVPPNTPFPDCLPNRDIYGMINEQEGTGQSWLRYARMDLGVSISELESNIIRDHLTGIQREALLDIGISKRPKEETPEKALARFHQQWLRRKTWFPKQKLKVAVYTV